ncbi:heavy metal-associated isoprenylated plant protein 16-like [Humulus lupulus]|uniref:heavy metal-associated isoprenylated plant protein 16-like n=1 Tax=Humulus lupulus TaxID=3486 RepID=UPI002B40C8F1|nr:heavy metal-associated isoprenylated plant protein 16-like [Humulus lupulus]XP_062107087.1 heavy metal-associated isoprenylated plant protein 16-like [Humulus lupulus]
MKLKVVIKVALDDQKCRTKAIKTAVGVNGVTQASLQQEKSQIEVTGDDIDVVLLTTLLRKSLKHAEVVSVSPIEKKEEDNKTEVAQLLWHPYVTTESYYQMPEPGYVSYNHAYHYQQPSSCSIM